MLANENEILVSIGHLPPRCSTKRLTARELAASVGVTERRINQLRYQMDWPADGPLGLEAVAQFMHSKTDRVTVTREDLHRATRRNSQFIVEIIGVWSRANLPPEEIVECVASILFDSARD